MQYDLYSIKMDRWPDGRIGGEGRKGSNGGTRKTTLTKMLIFGVHYIYGWTE